MNHGVAATYKRHKCRCDDCRAAKNDQQRRRRVRLREQVTLGEAVAPHGTQSGYSEYGCRCSRCRAVWSEKNAATPKTGRVYPSVQAGRLRYVEATAGAPRSVANMQWTGPEMEIAARTDLRIVDIALMLGRTYYAVTTMRQRIRTDDPQLRTIAGLSDRGVAS